MAGVVRSLITRILFKGDASGLKKIETQTTAVKREMRAASRSAYKFRQALSGVAVGWKTLVAGALVGRFAKAMTHDFAKSADEAAKFADGLGIPIQAYQRMTHAAQLNGISISELNTALPNLAKRAGDAADGSKEAALAFTRAGVKVKDMGGKLKDPVTLMTELADGIGKMGDKQRRTQVLMNLFGRAGKKMGVLMSQGSDGIRKAMQEADKLGVVLTRDQAKIAENYNDEMLRAKSVLIGLRNQIAIKLLPAITKNIKAFQMWARKGDNLKRMTNALIIVMKALGVTMAVLVTIKMAETLGAIGKAAKLAAHWLTIMWKAQLLAYAKFILIAAAVAAIVLVIQSLVVWAKGGKSAVGDLLEHFGIAEGARKVVDALARAWKAFVAFLPKAGKHLLKVLTMMGKLLSALWDEFGPELTELGKAMVELFREVYPVMVSLATAAGEAMVQLVHDLGTAWREDVKPAIKQIGAALEDLWVAAAPIMNALIEAEKTWLGWIWQAILVVVPLLADAFKGTFKIITMVIKSSIIMLTEMVKKVTWVVNKMKKAYDIATAILGLGNGGEGKGGTFDSFGGVARPGSVGGRSLPRTVSNTLSVGAVSVQVQGTANMTPAEFQAAVEAGTKRVLQGEINDVVGGMRSLVPV